MIQIDNCQLEIDVDRGVLYVHSSDGVTLVRVCRIPARVMELSYDKRNHYWKGMIDVVYDGVLSQVSAKGGDWTRCSCGHIAQEHNKDGKCEECACLHYDGECR